ncbi:MAG: FeoB-associated Cys-rich membrane protein [Candidatus Scatosoma sp.]
MKQWLTENLSTIIIAAILLAVLTAITTVLIKNKKKGKSPCGCGCKDCALHGCCGGTRPDGEKRPDGKDCPDCKRVNATKPSAQQQDVSKHSLSENFSEQ